MIEQENTSIAGGIAARLVAFELLNGIFMQNRNFDEVVAASSSLKHMSSRDRAFVRLLVATVLKRARQMDQVLQAFLHEPIEDLKPANLINVFRLGFAQIGFLKTPEHAAVDTTVSLAEAIGAGYQKPLVNAIMRRLTREGFPDMNARDAGRLATPAWLWQEWVEDYGLETALDIAATHFDEAPLDITVKGDPSLWVAPLEAQMLPTGTLRREMGGFIPDMPGFAEGEWWVQNAAAALPAQLLLKMQDETVVDLCAAPGGKTAQLAASGAKVIAVDRSSERIKRLKENLERLKLSADTFIADGAVWQPKEKVSAVLLDAPCTATGTIRHQPDVLHLKELRDQEKLMALQRRLIINAANMLKPGGTLVYCTCSLQKAEGESQVDWVLAEDLPLQLDPITPADIPGITDMITPRGEIRALPQHWQDRGGVDGFYVARFKKI